MKLDDGGKVFPKSRLLALVINPANITVATAAKISKVLGKPVIPDHGTSKLTGIHEVKGGMSLRDYYAGQIMSNPQIFDEAGGGTKESAATFIGIQTKDYVAAVHFPRVIAKSCYEYADAMIARKRETEK